eukprot:CAMPEP_0174719412 /NCGR_PEP_ID=MMETSP1094-20130205/31074_1 /TAXON_ID=156173 /ORGANISM="Chrysochromulina brevifilum, Strain UTEX LB 985" /LENGTH=46 /DNA_ID= /DNA_START= /DNA_END= /DNA_ORIENTATION=
MCSSSARHVCYWSQGHLLRGKPKEAAMSLTPPNPAATLRRELGLVG